MHLETQTNKLRRAHHLAWDECSNITQLKQIEFDSEEVVRQMQQTHTRNHTQDSKKRFAWGNFV